MTNVILRSFVEATKNLSLGHLHEILRFAQDDETNDDREILMGIFRTRFKKEIITEFLAPRNRKSGKVMIFCSGVPGVPHKDDVLEFFASKGYWTFFPRYRGTWESKGSFLKKSPEVDVLDVIDGLSNKFKDYWSGQYFQVKPKSIVVVGSSFGGSAALLATRDARVSKAICISPVVDWCDEDKHDPLSHLYEILHEGYGAAYRIKKRHWNKLAKGKFYNPVKHLSELNARKIMILHAKDDDVVQFSSVNKFAKKLKCEFVVLKKGGHLSSSLLTKPRYLQKINKFIRSPNR